MKSYPECIPCYLKQVLRTASFVTTDEKLQFKILTEASKMIKNLNFDESPAYNSYLMLKLVPKITGIKDPYKQEKEKYNRLALRMFKKLEKMVESSDDRFLSAIKMSIAGNIIDLGILEDIDLDSAVENAIKIKLVINHYQELKSILKEKRKILYLCDNAGEIVFDTFLIRHLSKEHELKVKVNTYPILNDATVEDAEVAGIHKFAEVVETGNDCVGIILEKSSKAFKLAFEEADLIISKGQGNFETLSESEKDIFFLLKAKCKVVANFLNVNQGDTLLAYNKRLKLGKKTANIK